MGYPCQCCVQEHVRNVERFPIITGQYNKLTDENLVSPDIHEQPNFLWGKTKPCFQCHLVKNAAGSF